MTGCPWPSAGRTGTVVTVGTFDGVHRGHRIVLEEVVRRARSVGRKSLLVTFEPHPLEVVNPEAAPKLLTVAAERREVLAQTELDGVVFLKFDHDLSQLGPPEFVSLLKNHFSMADLVIGYDHGFGRGRAGNAALLSELGSSMSFDVHVVPEVELGRRTVSSTIVRRAVAGGDLKLAESLLGRRYSLTASVVAGVGRGRQLGYPTVNLEPDDPRKLLPPNGVYAVWAEWAGGAAGGMMHQGPRPTFGESGRSLEIHLLDRSDQLYGKEMKVSWVERLRDVVSFPSVDALKAQLAADTRAARAALTADPGLGNH
jgi:riboflavin kinase/FMN adenylyltransferase